MVSASLKQAENSSNRLCETREAVRLMHGDDAALAGFARSLQHGLDLDRMVSVIVEDADAVPFAGQVKRRLTPAKEASPLVISSGRNAEALGDGNRRGGVRDIVAAGHRQAQILRAGSPGRCGGGGSRRRRSSAPSMRMLEKRTSACGFSP
jgi:hypothetical protein